VVSVLIFIKCVFTPHSQNECIFNSNGGGGIAKVETFQQKVLREKKRHARVNMFEFSLAQNIWKTSSVEE